MVRARLQATLVLAAFREKYGFSDWILNPLRGRNPEIMRLMPRGAR
jgi:hypothetical protein